MSRPAVFLDRDGTLNEEREYLHKPEALELIPGAAEAVARLNAAGIPVVVISNQGGIGLGYFTWEDFLAVTRQMEALLKHHEAHLDGVYASPHHPRGIGEWAVADHPDRKPNPGMLIRAAEELGLDLARSWMVGDKSIDVEAGHRAGCRSCLVQTGYGATENPGAAELIAPDLAAAVSQILEGWPWNPR